MRDFPGKSFICGAISGLANIFFMYPISKLTYRQIIDRHKASDAMVKIHSEGYRLMYRGILAPLLQKCVTITMMFGLYYELENPLKDVIRNEYLNQATRASISGIGESFFTPLERIQPVLLNSEYHHKYTNMFHAFKTVYKDYGIKELYKGYNLLLIRNITVNTVFFMSKELVNKHAEKYNQKGLLFDFYSGAILGATISMMFYPVKVLRTDIHKCIDKPHKPYIKIIKETYQHDWKHFFRGAGLNYVRALISWGISNQTYEFLMKNI